VEQVIAALGSVLIAIGGLAASNLLYDRDVDSSVSRCIASALGGAAYLVAVLWMDAWMAVSLSGVLALFILALRLMFRQSLRGATTKLSHQAWAEVTFPITGTAVLAIGWGLLGDRWLAFLPIAFMSWGDGAAGLVRAARWGYKIPSIWPSVAMICVCLVAATMFQPYWISASAAVAATAAERLAPKVFGVLDDNLPVAAVSLSVMWLLT